jgi:hypothetical protein
MTGLYASIAVPKCAPNCRRHSLLMLVFTWTPSRIPIGHSSGDRFFLVFIFDRRRLFALSAAPHPEGQSVVSLTRRARPGLRPSHKSAQTEARLAGSEAGAG